MCDSHKSVALVHDRLSSVEEVGSHASHELGHLLNMAHDDGRKGKHVIMEGGSGWSCR